MAAPNVNSPTRVEFKTARLAATTASQTIVSCGAASNMAIRVVSLVAANIDGTNAADVTVTTSDGTATRSIVSTVTVPADASLVIASRENPIHLPEGWTLAGLASAAGDIEFTTAHEEIT
jgi:hypothetical protein